MSQGAARPYAHLPGGHQEAWADAFCNVMRDVYAAIAAGPPYPRLTPVVATFEDATARTTAKVQGDQVMLTLEPKSVTVLTIR